MVESTRGLVLRTRPLTETSLIVHWLTPELGRLATVAKGARRAKSPFLGKLDVLYLADFSFSRSQRSELHNLREVKVRETHYFLRRELGYLQQAAYCVRLIEQATEVETPLGGIYELLQGFLQALPSEPCRGHMILAFELKLLAELGLQPDLAQAQLSRGVQALVAKFEQSDWPGILRVRMDLAQQKELELFLQHFLQMHLGRVSSGRESALRPSSC